MGYGTLLARLAVQIAGAAHAFEVALDPDDALADQAAVDLDLAFTGTAEEAEAAALAFQVGPRPDQAAALVARARQFDLQAAFTRPGAGAEDFQDQSGAVDHLGFQAAFEIALLDRRQRMVHHHQIDRVPFFLGLTDQVGEVLQRAGAKQGSRLRTVDLDRLGMDDIQVDRGSQPFSFLKTSFRATCSIRGIGIAQDRVNHDGAAGARGRPAITLIGCVRCFHLP